MTSLEPKNEAKNALRSLIKSMFSLELKEFNDDVDFSNLLDICKNIKNLNLKGKLLFVLYEIIFMEEKKLKTKIDTELLKCFEIAIGKNTNPEEVSIYEKYIQNELDSLDIIFPKKKGWTNEIKSLLSFIMTVKKDFGILFKCVEIVMSYNDKYYIPNDNNYEFSKYSLDDLLDQLYDYFMYNHSFTPNKNYTIIYKDNNFININCKTDEILQYINKEKYEPKILKKFTKINSDIISKANKKEECSDLIKDNDDKLRNNDNNYEETTNISKDNDDKSNNNNENCLDKKKDDDILNNNKKIEPVYKTYLENNNNNCLNDEILFQINNKINDFKENLGKEIDELKLELKNQKLDYEEKIEKQKIELKNQKLDYEEKIEKQKIDYEEKIQAQKTELKNQKTTIDSLSNESRQYKENSQKLKEQVTHLKVGQRKLTEQFKMTEQDLNKRIKSLENELDTIKCRGLIKSLLDFIYYVFFDLNYKKNYDEKKNDILKKISSLKKN